MIEDATGIALTSVAVLLYEALRQLDFPGLSAEGHLTHETAGEWKDYL